MDLMDICAATSTGDNTQRVNKKNKAWHKQLHLRKSVVEPSTMQSEDKSGPKKIAEEWEHSTVWSSSKKSFQEAQQSHNTLRFTCSQCRDNLEYVPKDLVKHFEEKHKGSLPVFSCHTCTFNTHEFSYLQVHLLSHKDTFSSCNICNDNVQRTWSEFSAHLTMDHCQNGKYLCETCKTFSTADVQVFLDHMCVHNLHQAGANGDLSSHTKDKNPFGSKTATQKLHCQHCDYEASQKWLIAKHIKAVHVRQNGNQRKKKKELHSLAMKQNDPIPKMKPRLTRSAVREMCWLTQDCLSLPGREFLDKYCHLSDPQTTLEETQQFLMKSVARKTSDQKWTKALKTVLSNVPQDMNLHPKSENGIMLNSSDLTFLTVKNKITVAQNGASYAKRLKRMTSSETVIPESAAADACCVVDHNGCQPDLNDNTVCEQTETKLHTDISVSAQNEPFVCAQLQENRENRELETDQEEHGKHQESIDEDEINISSELKLTNDYKEQVSICKVPPKNRRRNLRWRRKARYRKVDKRSSALKIVLKKNPVKEKQWVSQRSLSTTGNGSADHGPPDLHTTTQETGEIYQNVPVTKVYQKKSRACKTDLTDQSEALTSVSQSKPRLKLSLSCDEKPTWSKSMYGNEPDMVEGSLSTHQETQGVAEMSPQFLETKVVKTNSRAAAEMCSESVQLHTGSGMDDCMPENKNSAVDGVTSYGSYVKSSPVSQPVIMPQDKINLDDSNLALSEEHSKKRVEGTRDGEFPADPCSDFTSSTQFPAGKAIQQEPSPASGNGWQSVPKNLERTLKLVAINPSQLVKRPTGDQPVVVLNHPDADIPEVARIMEVINRYRGEVQKVVLSRRTLNALSAMNGEVLKTNDPANALPDSIGQSQKSVQERFILKLKLRRLSRKKYEVVGAVSPSREAVPKFRCWFCGRGFESREIWMSHRQRHLME